MNTNAGRVKAGQKLIPYDIAIIGGGVNGTAIARDMAGRGYSVLLLESGDLAGATSSASTKLIHGGLRYLEYGELRLVKKALAEREVLLRTAPHIVSPLRFVLPRAVGARPRWMLKLGLALYDHLASRDVLPDSESLDLTRHEFGQPFAGRIADGFAYSDCWVDDARLVILQAADAARQGAAIFTRTRVRDVTPSDGGWDIETDQDQFFHARMVVNATGPWVRAFLDHNGLTAAHTPNVRLVRGSHIVVPQLFEGDHAYILQQPDGRVVFAIPYEEKFTLIGTTDMDHGTDANVQPVCTPQEAQYLCDAANRFFIKAIAPADIVWSYSGVRPLFDNGRGKAAAVTRDYHLYLQRHDNAPIISIYGGKITTCRLLASDVADEIERTLGARGAAWTHQTPLPGGDIVERDFYEFMGDMAAYYHWFPADALLRMAKAYGTQVMTILGNAKNIDMLGRNFGGGLFQAEVDYMIRAEWARTADDILWRRSKLGLHVGADTVAALKKYLGEA